MGKFNVFWVSVFIILMISACAPSSTSSSNQGALGSKATCIESPYNAEWDGPKEEIITLVKDSTFTLKGLDEANIEDILYEVIASTFFLHPYATSRFRLLESDLGSIKQALGNQSYLIDEGINDEGTALLVGRGLNANYVLFVEVLDARAENVEESFGIQGIGGKRVNTEVSIRFVMKMYDLQTNAVIARTTESNERKLVGGLGLKVKKEQGEVGQGASDNDILKVFENAAACGVDNLLRTLK